MLWSRINKTANQQRSLNNRYLPVHEKAPTECKPSPRMTMHADVDGYPITGIYRSGFPPMQWAVILEFPRVFHPTVHMQGTLDFVKDNVKTYHWIRILITPKSTRLVLVS